MENNAKIDTLAHLRPEGYDPDHAAAVMVVFGGVILLLMSFIVWMIWSTSV